MSMDLLAQLATGARGLREGRMARGERQVLAVRIEYAIDWIQRLEKIKKDLDLEADSAYANGYRDGFESAA